MKNIPVIVLLLLCQFVLAQRQPSPSGVKLISATTQEWMTGAAPGKSGITYTLKIKILVAKRVDFKNLWISQELEDFDVQTFFLDPNKKPAQGDSVLLVYTRIDKTPPPVKINLPVPIAYKGAALLEYYVAGRPRYLVIKKFEKLKVIKGQ